MKDLPKGADQQWVKKAKQYTQWVRKHASDQEGYWRKLLIDIEAAAPEKFQEEFSKGETDDM